MGKWEESVRNDQPEWMVLRPAVDEISTGGQRYLPQPDGSLIAQGYAPTKHTVKLTITNDLQQITAHHGGAKKFQGDRYWRDLILFYEYFHGDNGAGIGASHQTGWTGLVAPLMHLFGSFSAESMLETLGKAVDTR